MHLKKVIALAILIGLPIITQTYNPSNIEKELTGKLIYIGPTIRLMYEFTPKKWNSLGLELQLELIRLDSCCYTDNWLRGARKYYKLKFWKDKIENGTIESRAWGIEPGDSSQSYSAFRDNPILSNYVMEW